MASVCVPPSPNIQHNIEDKTFKTLIKKYTKVRDWAMVASISNLYGKVMEDREKGLIP